MAIDILIVVSGMVVFLCTVVVVSGFMDGSVVMVVVDERWEVMSPCTQEIRLKQDLQANEQNGTWVPSDATQGSKQRATYGPILFRTCNSS
jgi:hypothetical protein